MGDVVGTMSHVLKPYVVRVEGHRDVKTRISTLYENSTVYIAIGITLYYFYIFIDITSLYVPTSPTPYVPRVEREGRINITSRTRPSSE